MFSLLCRVLGIPTERVVDFKISFWSGAIYSLLIGILVGGFVLFIENRIEKRYLRRTNDMDLVVLINRINTLIKLPSISYIGSEAKTWLPDKLIKSVELIIGSPTYIWENSITKKFIKPFNEIKKFYQSYEDFIIASEKLDLLLYQEGIRAKSDKLVILGIINEDKTYINKLKIAPSHEIPGPTHEAYKRIIGNSLTKMVLNEYRINQLKLLNDFHSLQNELREIK